jgi:hypothetical protein
MFRERGVAWVSFKGSPASEIFNEASHQTGIATGREIGARSPKCGGGVCMNASTNYRRSARRYRGHDHFQAGKQFAAKELPVRDAVLPFKSRAHNAFR